MNERNSKALRRFSLLLPRKSLNLHVFPSLIPAESGARMSRGQRSGANPLSSARRDRQNRRRPGEEPKSELLARRQGVGPPSALNQAIVSAIASPNGDCDDSAYVPKRYRVLVANVAARQRMGTNAGGSRGNLSGFGWL
jgi:hypothetical protein